jgi:hypothetical protein
VFPEQCALIQCPSGRRSARSADDASSNAVSRERASVRSAGGQTVEVDWRIEARLSLLNPALAESSTCSLSSRFRALLDGSPF